MLDRWKLYRWNRWDSEYRLGLFSLQLGQYWNCRTVMQWRWLSTRCRFQRALPGTAWAPCRWGPSNNQSRDTEWPHTTWLGLSLLNTSNVSEDLLDGNWVFDCESVRLSVNSGHDLSTRIRAWAFRPAKTRDTWMSCLADLEGGDSKVLELESRPLFASHPRMTTSLSLTLTAAVTRLKASKAYSTSFPSPWRWLYPGLQYSSNLSWCDPLWF